MTFLGKKATPTTAISNAEINREALLAAVPHLRAFARLLQGSRERADMLAQEVIVLARATPRFILPGNDMKLWLFSLAHSLHHRELQKAGARHDAFAGAGAHDMPEMPCQEACCASHGFSFAFGQLPCEEREALILVEAAGLTDSEAASVCSCPTETIKSRVSRARARLLQILVDGAAPPTAESAKQLPV